MKAIGAKACMQLILELYSGLSDNITKNEVVPCKKCKSTYVLLEQKIYFIYLRMACIMQRRLFGNIQDMIYHGRKIYYTDFVPTAKPD